MIFPNRLLVSRYSSLTDELVDTLKLLKVDFADEMTCLVFDRIFNFFMNCQSSGN